jgi:hypothetical protein
VSWVITFWAGPVDGLVLALEEAPMVYRFPIMCSPFTVDSLGLLESMVLRYERVHLDPMMHSARYRYRGEERV